MHKFQAKQITILHFSETPDRQGHTIPPECVCVTNGEVPVIFDTNDGPITIGKATLLPRKGRQKNQLVADLVLESRMRHRDGALALIQKLYPCVIMKILDASRHIVTRFSVEFILLAQGENCDPKITPLGVAVMPIKEELDA